MLLELLLKQAGVFEHVRQARLAQDGDNGPLGLPFIP
jgi:hypothetical protein